MTTRLTRFTSAAIVGKPFLVYFSVRTPDGTQTDSRLPRTSQAEQAGKLSSVIAFARWDRSPTLVLPSDRMDYVTDLFDRHDLLKTIEKHLG